MPPPIIFISHSAKEQPAKDLLDGLEGAMRAAGLLTFVDREITRGENFKKRLSGELYTCRGAIVLLSPHALESTWVRREVDVLMIRHLNEKEAFPLLPVLVAGTTRDDLKRSPLSDLNLPDLHAPRTAAKDVVPEIVDLFKQLCGPPGPLHDIEVTLASMLPENDEVLKLVAEVLDVDLTRWQPYGKPRAVAREMLRSSPANFAKAMNKIGYGVVENPCGIINLVFPFTWIDERPAARLAEVARAVLPRPSLAVNSRETMTGRWYVRRACPEPQPWRVAEPVETGKENYDQALEDQVREAILEPLGYLMDDEVTDDDLADRLRIYEEDSRGPIFVLLPAVADEITIAGLRNSFPGLVFLVLLGEVKEPAGVQMLEPLLAEGVEKASHSRYWMLMRKFEQPAPGRGHRQAVG